MLSYIDANCVNLQRAEFVGVSRVLEGSKKTRGHFLRRPFELNRFVIAAVTLDMRKPHVKWNSRLVKRC